MGFCFGVKKSVDLAKNALKEKKDNLYMLGSIINNPQVIKYFTKEGVKLVDNLDEIPEESTVITRAHGISPKMLKKAYQKKLSVVDTTCPYVKKVPKDSTIFTQKELFYSCLWGQKTSRSAKLIGYDSKRCFGDKFNCRYRENDHKEKNCFYISNHQKYL